MTSGRNARIAAVILAAGMSRRMGRPKPLLDFDGMPLIGRIIEALQSVNWEGEAPAEPTSLDDAARREPRPPGTRIHPIVVVSGHQREAIVAACEYSGVQFVHNPLYETGGMISSVQAGVRAVAPQCDAFLLVLADHSPPWPDTLRAMIDAWRESHSAIVLPTHHGKHGHPILISTSLVNQILALTFQETLASIVKLNSRESRDVAVDDPAILEDIDTPEDYNRALGRWKEQT